MKCVILGAGKIARGFIGHLLYLNGIPFTFVEKFDGLADLINERGQYTVNILGNSEKNCVVKGVKAIRFSDVEKVAEAIAEADAVFTSVGGKNLGDLVPLLVKGIERKAETGGNLNVVTCENWKLPATILKNGVEESISEEAKDYFHNHVGITEAVIMRSAIESDAELLKIDPLVVNVQDFWELPVDASRIVGSLPEIKELKLIHEFTGFLERKFYTYNAANGTTSYLGALLGYEKIADAAHDERILKILDGVYQETAQALSKKHNFPLEEQLAFTLTSKKKLQDYTIVDFIERNARDPLRKLGPDDRLVGSARLVLEYGIKPHNLCIAIASAIHYVSEGDEFARELVRMRTEEGIDAVIEKVCKLDPNGELGMLIKEKIELLKEWGWIHELPSMPQKGPVNLSAGKIAVVGAGKTGRGFIGRLLAEDGCEFLLIDKNAELVQKLNEKKSFKVSFFGNVREPQVVTNYKAVTWADADLSDVELIFVSVGGTNLTDVGAQLRKWCVDGKKRYIITGENATKPAKTLLDAIASGDVSASRTVNVAGAEATVFCTTIEDGELDISSENYPYLQCDAKPLDGYVPPVSGVKPIDNFGNFLTRKLFTYNAASCVIAYLGFIKGFTDYGDAANDPEILELLDRNYAATNEVLCQEFGYTKEDQEEFALLSKKKFCDRTIIDTVARNAREPQRKMKAGERIMGPLVLLDQYGADTSVLIKTVAAMLLYRNEGEDKWQEIVDTHTPAQVLAEIGGVPEGSKLSEAILKEYDEMKKHVAL